MQAAGLSIDLDAETTTSLQDPAVILAHKQVMGGPSREALQAELAQLSAVVETQRQTWQSREAALQAQYDITKYLQAAASPGNPPPSAAPPG